MKNRIRRIPLFMILALLALALTACDSGDVEEEEEEEEPPPSFELATRTVQLADGTPGIEFFLTPNEDIVLVRVDMETPLGGDITFNAGSATVVRGQSFALQDAGTAYRKVSGNWTFTLIGNKAAGSRESFNVTMTENVSS